MSGVPVPEVEPVRPRLSVDRISGRGRGWTLRRHITVAFAVITSVSILGIGVVGFVEARELITTEVEGRLAAIQDERLEAIENGLDTIRSRMSVAASDPGVASAAGDLLAAFEELDGVGLDPDGTAEVAAAFDDVSASGELAERLAAYDLELPRDLGPLDATAEYLLYHYVIAPDGDDRAELADAGDGSAYSAVHADLHGELRDLAEAARFDQLLIVRADDARIVYSTDKGFDFAGSLRSEPVSDGSLADALAERLLQVPSGEAVFLDFTPYLARAGQPVMFVAAIIRDGQEAIGVLVGEIPTALLNEVMNAGGSWEDIGLGDTGQTYVVGSDGRLRSDTRRWIEDPEGYLDDLGDTDEAAAIRSTGSTVYVQRVDTAAVRAARDGDRFVGESDGPLGDDTLTVASTIDAAGLDWVVVADLETGEARDPLEFHLLRVLLAAVLLGAVVALLSWWLARRLAAPIRPLSDAAEAIAAGDLDPPLDDRSADEFAHLGRQLRRYATALADEREALRSQERATEELLRSALPDRAVAAVLEHDLELGDLLDEVTVVVVLLVVGDADTGDIGPEADVLAGLVADVESEATRHGLERVHSSVDHHVFLAGVGENGVAANEALAFARAVEPLVERVVGDTGSAVRHGVAMSSGPVATGMIDPVGLTYSVWGAPARQALEMAIGGGIGHLLLDPSTVDALPDHERAALVSRRQHTSDGETEVFAAVVGSVADRA